MIYFFSYGDEKYHNSKQRIKQEAINLGVFDDIQVYGKENIDDEFVTKTSPWLNMPRGGGFWLWKSYFLKQTFHKMNEGDYCVYADAGCHLNINGSDRLKEYLSMIETTGILSFRMDGLDEEKYTNEKVFEYFNISKEDPIRKTGQIVGGILFLKKTENSTKIVDEYYNIAITNPSYFSDDYNNYNRTNVFVDHRHDQSILSILRKKYGSTEIHDETYAEGMEGWNNLLYNKKIPILATRIRQ